LNEQLELYLTQPERLFSQPVRAAAHETLGRAKSIASPGPVLQSQIEKLSDWLSRADAPVPVALQSDNQTQSHWLSRCFRATLSRSGARHVHGCRYAAGLP
jgi:predicted MarR family transcription regulator